MNLTRASIRFENTTVLQNKLSLIGVYNGDCTKFKNKVRSEVNKVLKRLHEELRTATVRQDPTININALHNIYEGLHDLQVNITDGGLAAFMIFECRFGYNIAVSFSTSISETIYSTIKQAVQY